MQQHFDSCGLSIALEDIEIGPDHQDDPLDVAEPSSLTAPLPSSTENDPLTSSHKKRSFDDMAEGEDDTEFVDAV